MSNRKEYVAGTVKKPGGVGLYSIERVSLGWSVFGRQQAECLLPITANIGPSVRRPWHGQPRAASGVDGHGRLPIGGESGRRRGTAPLQFLSPSHRAGFICPSQVGRVRREGRWGGETVVPQPGAGEAIIGATRTNLGLEDSWLAYCQVDGSRWRVFFPGNRVQNS